MIEEIEQAVQNISKMNPAQQAGVRLVLGRYASGDVTLDEAYYQLLDESLIPMPSRCGLKAKIEPLGQEERLKDLIRRLL
ncbi:MAG: hypothetical protein A4E45_00104 [Methanosaeta sp. PtaB.Bin039]|nr:MAG: hypothetical protein A4E45_00104 [Methanosaeta sp. PtaB.Bin039]OPY47563.1 MAG: hypothetical protein A4E47_00217 [Methanosaeta sp. PtaU1.Bin028]HOT06914.1 hypothetical protein [Methanotrichaceae archaeon]HQF16464.1 hypothetical protein [Methanotrichaceae archaeon]HQI91887.1 hypothetical protein [Methanotrichaceae archaeon]